MTHDERVTGLLQANNRIVDLARAFKVQLRKNHALFTRYAAEHNKKADAFAVTAKEYEEIAITGSSPRSREWREKEEASRAKAVTNVVAALEIEILLAQH